MNRDPSAGQERVLQTEADVPPVRTKSGAGKTGGSKTGVGDVLNEQRPVSPIEPKARSVRTKAGRKLRRSQPKVSEDPSQSPDRKARRVKVASAPDPSPTRERGKRVAGRRPLPVGTARRRRTEPQLEAITKEVQGLKAMVQRLVPSGRSIKTRTADPILEGAVDSLRRLLSELLEHRMEEVAKDLTEVRREATSASHEGGGRVVERLDQMLESLGVVKFEAPQFDAMDPLIHVAVEERHEEGVPDGVILATVRPGFRTGRGLVLCKAAVAVSRGA